MKSTVTINQKELEQKAIDSMIAYEKKLISEQEMKEAITRALHHYGNREGHREIVLKGWIIETIYALDGNQLKDLDRVIFMFLNGDIVYVIRTYREMTESKAYREGNWEIVKEYIAPAPGDGGAHLYAIRAADVQPGEWIYDDKGNYMAERIDY